MRLLSMVWITLALSLRFTLAILTGFEPSLSSNQLDLFFCPLLMVNVVDVLFENLGDDGRGLCGNGFGIEGGGLMLDRKDGDVGFGGQAR